MYEGERKLSKWQARERSHSSYEPSPCTGVEAFSPSGIRPWDLLIFQFHSTKPCAIHSSPGNRRRIWEFSVFSEVIAKERDGQGHPSIQLALASIQISRVSTLHHFWSWYIYPLFPRPHISTYPCMCSLPEIGSSHNLEKRLSPTSMN